jgi:hypothetical protein
MHPPILLLSGVVRVALSGKSRCGEANRQDCGSESSLYFHSGCVNLLMPYCPMDVKPVWSLSKGL